MIWKDAAEEKLTMYPVRVAAAQNLQEQLQLLKCKKGSINSPQYNIPRVCSTPGRREDLLLNEIALEQELKWALAQTQTWIRVTERALDTLPSDDRSVLEGLYMEPDKGNIDKLCRKMMLERSSIYRRRDNALRRFTAALYGGS